MLAAIFITLLSGILLAAFGIVPPSLADKVSDYPYYCLCFLLFVVGYGIGRDKEAFRRVIKGNVKTLLIPLGTVIGALIGGIVSAFILSVTLREAMAVACGFGWYSYSAVYLAEVHSADLGAVAFLANVFREVFAIFLIPFAVRFMGPMPAVSLGGATTMDVTLPIITRYAGSTAAVAAFVHGIVLSAITPVLLPFIIG